jgi:hypothetical protein
MEGEVGRDEEMKRLQDKCKNRMKHWKLLIYIFSVLVFIRKASLYELLLSNDLWPNKLLGM